MTTLSASIASRVLCLPELAAFETVLVRVPGADAAGARLAVLDPATGALLALSGAFAAEAGGAACAAELSLATEPVRAMFGAALPDARRRVALQLLDEDGARLVAAGAGQLRNSELDAALVDPGALFPAARATDLAAHEARRDNPHGVTAAQAGALPATGGQIPGALSVLGGFSSAMPVVTPALRPNAAGNPVLVPELASPDTMAVRGDVPPVVAPSAAAAAAGKAADAKATGDALAGKLDRSGGTMAGNLALDYYKLCFGGPHEAYAAMGDAADEVVFACGDARLTLRVGGGGTAARTSDLRYALGNGIAASATLADRCMNRVAPAADNAAAIALAFPGAVAGQARDFLVLVTNTAGNTGAISFAVPQGATVWGDGLGTLPAAGETWLYSVTEVAANAFLVRAQKMEAAQ